MKIEEFNITNLTNAARSLSVSIAVLNKRRIERASDEELQTIEAGVIQNFEFAYELAWKTIRRYIQMVADHPAAIEGIPRQKLFAMSKNNGLIGDVELWVGFNEARNSTSHNYDDSVAKAVLQKAVDFDTEVKRLLENFKERLAEIQQ
jgi:nucleotidyltransferase substrate binding protein (TIGR01987 family)